MRFFPQELLMLRLRGKRLTRGLQARRAMEELYSKSNEECLAELRRLSGEDFGDDLDRWEEWVRRSVKGSKKEE